MALIVNTYYISQFKTGIVFLNKQSTKEICMTTVKDNKQWNVTRGKIKTKFGKLNDKQLDGLNGHMEKLPGLVQEVYKYDHSKAIQECKAFREAPKMTK
jgi:uncharacterized protein YjbJ (UPF0337 family)